MDLGLAGKTAIVTGGGSNIGRAISLTLAAEKANVVIAEIDLKQAQKVAGQIKDANGQGIAVKCDITNQNEVEGMVKQTIDTFGGVHILINNVGWVFDRPFIDKPVEEWQKEVNINYWGTIYCTRAVLGHMVEQKYGRIVSIMSDSARVGEAREAVYAGCKAAVGAMSKSVAKEVGRFNVTLNMVSPGATLVENLDEDIGENSMHQLIRERYQPEFIEKISKVYPLRRVGNAFDIANAVAFLASDRASWITGQILSVSGGFTMV